MLYLYFVLLLMVVVVVAAAMFVFILLFTENEFTAWKRDNRRNSDCFIVLFVPWDLIRTC